MPLFWWGSLAVNALLVVKLVRVGGFRFLPLFSAFATLRLTQGIGLSLLIPSTRSYAYSWLGSEIIAVMVVAAVVWELYRRNTERLHALGRLGAAVLIVSVVLAALVTIWTAWQWPGFGGTLANLFLYKRLLYSWLLVAITVLLSFYWRFPLPLDQSLKAHAWITGAYLTTHVAGYWGQAARPKLVPAWNEFMAVAWCGCLLAWLFCVREPKPPVAATEEELAAAEEQAGQLERILGRI